MLDFGIYITGLITIIVGYLALYVPMRKELKDLENIGTNLSKEEQLENNKKIGTRNSLITLINILFLLFGIIITILYFFIHIKQFFTSTICPIFKNIIDIMCDFF